MTNDPWHMTDEDASHRSLRMGHWPLTWRVSERIRQGIHATD